ncbi:hypothetical protein GTA08_BOTSDO13969 [Botryosphaeria dothidea]|uniref:Uncharacterized protein n=1 Tax=Botryosphaeria dothidea TaxID=55169 RepID=A0A8H4J0F7_9PEZI|nr:hypothetical protein GTA08_BOTSDO13969 [Botryosphaeria dothidea]
MSQNKSGYELAPLESGFGAQQPRASSAGSSDGLDNRYSPPTDEHPTKIRFGIRYAEGQYIPDKAVEITTYNSTFFVSLNNNGYDIYYASSEFPSGAPFELDVFPDPPSDVIDSYDIDGKARANFTFHLPDGTNKTWEMTLDYQTKPAAIQSDAGNLGVSNNGSYFERLNNSDCIRAYAQAILPSRRNLDDSYPEYNIPGAICSDGAWQSVRDDSSRWSVNGYDVEYCISEVVEDQCRLNVAINLLIVVIVFNAVKVVVITLVIWKIRDRPIVTVGDAAESFIRQPDITTKGMCLLTRADASKQSSKNVQFAYGPVEPKPYKMEKKRRGSAASKARWATAMILTSIALITILGLLGYAIRILKTQYDRGDAKSLVALGPRQSEPLHADPRLGPSRRPATAPIVATVLIANLPQLLLSLLYVLLNGLVTRPLPRRRMVAATRTPAARCASRTRAAPSAPRTSCSCRTGCALPLLAVSRRACTGSSRRASSSQKVDGVDPTGVPQDVGWGSGAVTCGYSPLGIVVTVVARARAGGLRGRAGRA